jgi:uncharacterized protein YcaQ
MPSPSWPNVTYFRAIRHHLDCRAPLKSLVTVVGDVCGVQAQLMSAAQIALWARVQGLRREDVERALWKERTLVKTWAMRGAVHLLPAKDLPVYVGALKRRVREERRWMARYGVGPQEADTMIEAIIDALAPGPLTRQELTERVIDRLGSKARRWVQHSWGGVVKQACLQGLACFGPNQGQEITFVRRDYWLPDQGDLRAEDAEDELLRHYLHGYGPAALQDFASWAGMTIREASPIRKRLGGDLVEMAIGDSLALILRQDLAAVQSIKAKDRFVRLLPSFDPYMLGHRDKRHLVDEADYKRVYRKAGWLSPVVLFAGRVMGVWSHERRGKGLHINVEPFIKMTTAIRDGIGAEATDLARFLGGTSEVAFISN